MSDPPAAYPQSHDRQTPGDTHLFSYEVFLVRMMGEDQLAQRVLRLFLQDVPLHVEALLRHIDNQDIAAAAKSAHTIKGAVGNLAADRLYKLCLEIEKTAREGDARSLPRLGRQFSSLFCQLMREIERVI